MSLDSENWYQSYSSHTLSKLIFFIFLTSLASFQKWHYIKGLVLNLALRRLVMTDSTLWTSNMDGISGPFYTGSTQKGSSQKEIKSDNTNYYCLEHDEFDHVCWVSSELNTQTVCLNTVIQDFFSHKYCKLWEEPSTNFPMWPIKRTNVILGHLSD